MKKRVDIARDVIAGYYGSGDKRIAALKKEGYDPDVVQGDVNTLLCCRENIIGNMKAFAIRIAADDRYWYIYYQDQYGKECAICFPHNGKNHGWQCIGLVMAIWHHAGLPIPCNCGVIDNSTWEKMLNAKTNAEALKIAKNHLKISDIMIICSKKGISKEKAQPGDMAALFNSNEYRHTYFIMSDSAVADATKTSEKANDIRADRKFAGRYVDNMKILIRYTGNGLCPPPKRTVDELAHEVLEGLWGSGDSRKKALTEAGHDYDAVQKRVNEILNPSKKKYSGELPTLKLVKTNAEVIADAIRWAYWIAGDNDFHYGYTNKHGSKDSKDWNPNAHHNGCYFCGTNVDHGGRSKKGIKDFEKTYCCNPAVTAAYAHGGCDQAALKKCRSGSSYVEKNFKASDNWKDLGKPKFSDLKKGDILYWEKKDSCHYAVYLGGGKLFEASGGDDNKKGSKKWNNSIHVRDINSWGSFQGAFRYIGSVNATCYIYHGEISKRVYLLQEYLNWYSDGQFFKECGPADGIYGDNTFKWCCRFQEEQIGKGEGDGIVGPKTIEAMGKVVK